MIEIGSETYYFDWDIFKYALMAVGLCLSLFSVSRFKIHLKIIAKHPRSFFALGVGTLLSVIAIVIIRINIENHERIVSYEEQIEKFTECDVKTECVVIEKCDKVQAINKRFEQEYLNELMSSSHVYLRGCLKGEPDSRKAQYKADCVQERCKEVLVKASTMWEVEDRLSGKSDP